MDTQSHTCNTPVGSSQSPVDEDANLSMPLTTSNEEGVTPSPSENTQVGRKRKLTSVVWNHYKKVKINGEDKAVCNYCGTKLGGKSTNGTKHLHDHLKRCPRRPVREDGQQVLGGEKSKIDGKMFLTKHQFNLDVSRKQLARAIVVHGLPLSFVEYCEIRKFMLVSQPLFKMPCQNTIKSHIVKIYEHEKSITMKMLERNESRIAITTDMWTSSNHDKGFMAITAHYIDDDWMMQSRIIRFAYVPCPHTSDVLAGVLFECMMDWNLDRKLSTVTVDNCTTNDAIIKSLLEKLNPASLLLGGKLLHLRCCAHILNLIVQDGLSLIMQGIEKVRNSVAYWSASPKRVEKFDETARQLQIKCKKKLSLDCKTRWNSTYLMLKVALEYKEVFMRLEMREALFKCCPTTAEWDVAEEVCDKLQVFHEVTEKFSGTKYPTANIFFTHMYTIRAALFSWKSSSSQMIVSMALSMIQKFEKYWHNIHGIMSVASVLDPRYKMKLLQFYFPKIYGSESCLEIEKVRTLCSKLVDEYQSRDSRVREKQDVVQSCDRIVQEDPLSDYYQFVSEASNDVPISELDNYLEEKVLLPVEKFDILSWWKTYGCKWPTLQKIVRDILAIPISTVASESAFSLGGNLITPHRSRLHPDTIEVLMCSQSWVRNEIQETDPEGIDVFYQTPEYDRDADGDEVLQSTTVKETASSSKC